MKLPTKGNGDAERRGTPEHRPKTAIQAGLCVCACVVRLANAAAESPFMTAVLIFLETTESVCCIGSVLLENSNLQRYLVWALFPTLNILSVLTFITFFSPVHLTLDDGTSEGLLRLFAGTVFYL